MLSMTPWDPDSLTLHDGYKLGLVWSAQAKGSTVAQELLLCDTAWHFCACFEGLQKL